MPRSDFRLEDGGARRFARSNTIGVQRLHMLQKLVHACERSLEFSLGSRFDLGRGSYLIPPSATGYDRPPMLGFSLCRTGGNVLVVCDVFAVFSLGGQRSISSARLAQPRSALVKGVPCQVES